MLANVRDCIRLPPNALQAVLKSAAYSLVAGALLHRGNPYAAFLSASLAAVTSLVSSITQPIFLDYFWKINRREGEHWRERFTRVMVITIATGWLSERYLGLRPYFIYSAVFTFLSEFAHDEPFRQLSSEQANVYLIVT